MITKGDLGPSSEETAANLRAKPTTKSLLSFRAPGGSPGRCVNRRPRLGVYLMRRLMAQPDASSIAVMSLRLSFK